MRHCVWDFSSGAEGNRGLSSIKSVFSGVLCTERFVVFGRPVARRVSYLSIVLEQKITGNI